MNNLETERITSESMLNAKRYVENALESLDSVSSRLKSINASYKDIMNLINESKGLIKYVNNKLIDLSYNLGRDIVKEVENIDITRISTDNLLSGYEYFKDSKYSIEEYIFYVLENGNTDDLIDLYFQINDEATCYILQKKYEKDHPGKSIEKSLNLIRNFFTGKSTQEEVNYFSKIIDKELLNKIIMASNRNGTLMNLANTTNKNTPENYNTFNFNPTIITDHKQDVTGYGYELKEGYEKTHVALEEDFVINGYNVKVIQTIPKDAIGLERNFYDVYKANVINTVKNDVPIPVLKKITEDGQFTINLVSDKSVYAFECNYDGYYRSGNVIVNAKGAFINNEFFTKNAVVHEIGHNLDDARHENTLQDNTNTRLDDTLFVSSEDKRIEELVNKYAKDIDAIDNSAYNETVFKKLPEEFFACSFDAYIYNPEALKTLCPEVYDMVDKMIGGTWNVSETSE